MENFCSCTGSLTRDNERTGEDDNDNDDYLQPFITDTKGTEPKCPLNKCTRTIPLEPVKVNYQWLTVFRIAKVFMKWFSWQFKSINRTIIFHYPFRAFHNWVFQNTSLLLKVKIRNWKENLDIYNNWDRDSRVFELIIALNALPLDQFLRLKNISEVAIIKIKAAPSLFSFPSRNPLL